MRRLLYLSCLLFFTTFHSAAMQTDCPTSAFTEHLTQGRVLPETERHLYDTLGGAIIATLPGNAVFTVRWPNIVCDGSGDLWMSVDTGETRGWIAELEAGVRHVEPFIGDAPDTSDDYAQPEPTGTLLLSVTQVDSTTESHYALDLTTNELTPVESPAAPFEVEMPVSVSQPSPDGTQIAFVGGEQGAEYLYLADADGTNITQLSDLPVSYYPGVRWTSDGEAVSFSSANEEGRYGALTVITLDSGESITYTLDGSTDYYVCGYAWSPISRDWFGNVASGEDDCVSGSFPHYARAGETTLHPFPAEAIPDYAWGHTWSPDGSRVLFTQSPTPSNGFFPVTPAQIFSANPDGSDLQQITVSPNRRGLDYDFSYISSPVWSPDGEWLAVVWYRRFHLAFNLDAFDIYLVDADGSIMRHVLSNRETNFISIALLDWTE